MPQFDKFQIEDLKDYVYHSDTMMQKLMEKTPYSD